MESDESGCERGVARERCMWWEWMRGKWLEWLRMSAGGLERGFILGMLERLNVACALERETRSKEISAVKTLIRWLHKSVEGCW